MTANGIDDMAANGIDDMAANGVDVGRGAPDRPHVVVVNRWREHYADYGDYLDHGANRVSYVTTEVGLDAVPEGAAEVALVDATDDLHDVRAAVRALAARHGPPSGVVALKEDDLQVGARLREEWDAPGQRTPELVPLQDKYVMCAKVQAAGLAVPAFAAAVDADTVAAFGDAHGWPVVIKPRVGSSSAGVQELADAEEARALRYDIEPLLVEEYRPEQIYHIDGVFDGERVLVWRASRYVNTCLGFRDGVFLGSVEVDDEVVNAAIGPATEQYVAALTSAPTVFHLELFGRRPADGPPEFTFLEIGARTGGAEIPFLWREVHGYDLMEAAYRIQLGQPIPRPGAGVTGSDVGGWLLIPAPAARPCEITESTSMVGRPDGPYAEAVLQPGQVLPAADAYYEHVGGRFRFRAHSSAAVEAALKATARDFRVAARTIDEEAPAGSRRSA